MRTIPIYGRVATFVGAIVLLLQMSPAIAKDKDDERGQRDNNRPVEVSFTKWVPAAPLMVGFTGGDAPGVFAGEILQRQVSTNPNLNGIIRLEAIYEVQSGRRSFTALIRGGTNAVTGAALLDGVILAGWRTGALVVVEFQTTPAPCAGAPTALIALTCFQGTIHVGPAPKH